MEKRTLGALAQYFAKEGRHFDLAGTISLIPRTLGDEYCPFCLGNDGRKSMMFAVEVPMGNSDIDDFYKCRTCTTIFQKNLQQLWSVTEL